MQIGNDAAADAAQTATLIGNKIEATVQQSPATDQFASNDASAQRRAPRTVTVDVHRVADECALGHYGRARSKGRRAEVAHAAHGQTVQEDQ